MRYSFAIYADFAFIKMEIFLLDVMLIRCHDQQLLCVI